MMDLRPYKFLIRVDASAKIGKGHIMRCLVLATELRKASAKIQFVTKDFRDISNNSITLIQKSGFEVVDISPALSLKEDLRMTYEMVNDLNADVIVTDGYAFIGDYLEGLKGSGRFLLCIDDTAHTFFPCDILVNQNINATEDMYRGRINSDTRLLLGPQYVLLREEFINARKREINDSTRNRILVTMGGYDPRIQTIKILKVLDAAKSNFDITVVINSIGQQARRISDFANSCSRKIDIVKDADNMAELMIQSDLAISGGGSTCWELAYLGIPNIIIVLVDNQQGVAEELHKQGISYNLGWYSEVTEERIIQAVDKLIADLPKRQSMSIKSRTLIDGKGGMRVKMEIEKFLKDKSLAKYR